MKWVMLLEGINDIGHGTTAPAEAVTAEDLIGAYKQIIERAHTHGVQVIGCTLTPYQGANYYREDFEEASRSRQRLDPHPRQLRRLRRFRGRRARSRRPQ